MADRIVKRGGIEIGGVYQGRAAGVALIGAFMDMRGQFRIEVSYGFEARHPDRMLVLVEIADVKAVFTPDELLRLGRAMISGLPMARRLGATRVDEDELSTFAEMLIRNAEDAAAISPHGLN